MKELSIEQLSKSYGVKQLINQVDFAIRTGDRIGLIGPNGTGKSSFLKVIAGVDHYDQGTIRHPNQYSIAYLDQHPVLDPDKTILETVYQSPAPIVQLVLRYEKDRKDLEQSPHDPALQAAFTKISEQMTQEGGWDVEVQAKSILTQLGLHDLDRRVGDCSGGQLKRIGLAQVLISPADLLILDEPTNHLDVPTIQWLEHHLASYPGALLLVTHDRYFLERVVNKIAELRHGRLIEYEGNYEAYLSQRASRQSQLQQAQHKQDRLFQQELAWMRQGAQARSTKQQARIQRFNDLKQAIAERDQEDQAIDFDFNQQRLGKKSLELDQVTIHNQGQLILKDYTKTFVKGDRMGIVGPNGVGKSTFLNTLAGYHQPTSGIIHIGETVRMAYYRQLDQDLPGDQRVLSYLTQVAQEFKRPDGSQLSASQLLERFNFPKESHGMFISSLSGGERRRLYLLTLLVQEPNLLLLDEPTNDLDIETLTTLEDYLEDFEGIVIVVSHDRYFLDKTVDQILIMQGQGHFDVYWGAYSDYLAEGGSREDLGEMSEPERVEAEPSLDQEETTPAVKTKKRMTYQEKQEWAKLQPQMQKVEDRIEAIGPEMEAASHDAGRLMDLQEELDQLELELLTLYERYDYLSDLDQ